jgi:lipopolysaccharide export system permease protein
VVAAAGVPEQNESDMRILTRYLLRAHLGPFLFSLSVLTGLLLINTVAKRFEDLAGKGLGLGIIAEVFLLSVPFTFALTLPMSVLVAVLYAFSQFTTDNEITALKASGVSLLRLSAPLFVAGLLMTGGMLYFNDQILAESNHRLKNLLVDIARKSPTLELKEQVINEIRTEGVQARYYLQPARIDAATNRLYDVVIYDLSSSERDRTIYADSGWMAFNSARTDLFLTLYDGWIHERETTVPDRFNRVFFQEQLIRIPEIGNQLERMGGGNRGDREMTIAMLAAEVARRRAELEEVQTRAREELLATVRVALGEDSGGEEGTRGADGKSGTAGTGRPEQHTLEAEARRVKIQLETSQQRVEQLQAGINEYSVEYHKKFAIPFACIVFVLIGAPLAVRFPRGGVGMVIAFSLVVFAIYWSGLTGGEQLGDKGMVPPFWGMWAVNFIFLGLGLFGLARFGRERSTTRGSALDDLAEIFRGVGARWRTRRLRGGRA